MIGSDKKFFELPFLRLGVFTLCLFVAVVGFSQQDEFLEQPDQQEGIFHGELDVSVINLYVTVVDKDGQAVPGLGPEDFEIFENGDRMEITNFSILEHGKKVIPEIVESSGGEQSAGSASSDPEVVPRYVAVLFDLPSLQRRNKSLVIDAVQSLVQQGLVDGDQFMVAVNSGELEILNEFSGYEASLMATLEGVSELEHGGDASKRSKRMLKRTTHTTRFMRMRKTPFGGDATIDQGYIKATAGMLQTEINNVRQLEYQRIRQSITVADELVRALAGIDGPKTVLWIGEDLAMRPAYDIYQVFYKKAANYQDILNLTHPESWSREIDLSREFQHLAASSQSSGVTFHVLDASDRDREMGSADFGSPGIDDIIASEAVGNLWTPGTDTTEFWDVTEGADYMALATGGSVQKNTRNLEGSISRIREQMVLTYSLGFQRPGAPDGKISRIQVKVKKRGLRVRHHEKVLNKTGDHHLADLALSRVRFDLGGNELGMTLVEGQPQPGEDGKIVRSIQFRVPVQSLVLMPNDQLFSGEVIAAVAVLDGEGKTAEPRLMRLSIAVPADRYQPDAIAARTLRLLMAPDTRRVAVGIRDEVSGLTSTAALDLSVVESAGEDN